jgi:hypothetical protein
MLYVDIGLLCFYMLAGRQDISLQMGKKMAGLTGIEPAISGLTGQRVRPDCTTAPQKILW